MHKIAARGRFISLWVVLVILLPLNGCVKGEQNVVFEAVIEDVFEGSILVTTIDAVGFDRASVSFEQSVEIPFTPAPGQQVELTILPEVRESYPVQATAVAIRLISEPQVPSYRQISAEQAYEMMAEGGVIVLDVRTQEEYDEGHIEGAVLLPDTEIARAEAELTDREAVLLVYCRTGRRSKLAAQALVDLGYRNVYDFGGIADWPYEVVLP